MQATRRKREAFRGEERREQVLSVSFYGHSLSTRLLLGLGARERKSDPSTKVHQNSRDFLPRGQMCSSHGLLGLRKLNICHKFYSIVLV